MTNYSTYINWRRQFHRFPELSDQEYKATKTLKQILKSYLDLPLNTGLVAEIGDGEDMVAVRTDIDALPNRRTSTSWIYFNKSRCHACGHDIHIASILAVVTKLKEIESQLTGRVRLIFQAAEELGHGAFKITDAGVLKGAKAVLGFHNYPTLNVGEFAIKSGVTTSSVGSFQFQIRGKGAHAAKPEQWNDPVVVVGQLINSLQTIISWNLSAFDNVVVTISEISCGNTWNVIADKAYIQGTVRSYSEKILMMD